MHRFSVYFSHVFDSIPYGEFPRPVRMEELITQPIRPVKMVQTIYEPPVLYIIGTFRDKVHPFTHKPQIIVKRFPSVMFPLIISSAFSYTFVILGHFLSRGSLPDDDMQTIVSIQLLHRFNRLGQTEQSLCKADSCFNPSYPAEEN